jgi:hypothetical protein
MGKSEFLEQDLIPAACNLRYTTIYLNLWDARADPTPALLAALTRALEPSGLTKIATTLKRPLKSIKASAKITGVAEGSIEAELRGGDTEAIRNAPGVHGGYRLLYCRGLHGQRTGNALRAVLHRYRQPRREDRGNHFAAMASATHFVHV